MATNPQANPKVGLDRAVALLSQQIWCWGRDIMRPEGNWLLEIGFNRIEPPTDRKECPSIYKLQLPHERYVLLRGFGVFYGDPKRGGIYLPRYEFLPLYMNQAQLRRLPWTIRDLPRLKKPSNDQQVTCIALMADLTKWIRHYESQTVDQLGIDYRRHTLSQWDDGTRPLIPAEEIASAWHEMTRQAESDFNAFKTPNHIQTKRAMAAKKRPMRHWLRMKKRQSRLIASPPSRSRLGVAN